MATTTAKGSGSINNNGATVIGGGSFDPTGPITNGLELRDLYNPGPYGSRVTESISTDDDFTDVKGVIVANSGSPGGLAYTPNPRLGERNFIIRGAGNQSAGKINGEDSDLLNSTGAEFAGITRGKANVKTGASYIGRPTYRTWTYPILPGSGRVPGLTRDPREGQSYSFNSTTDNQEVAVDKAISGTRAVPGELTYRTGAPLPVTTNFKPRDSVS